MSSLKSISRFVIDDADFFTFFMTIANPYCDPNSYINCTILMACLCETFFKYSS